MISVVITTYNEGDWLRTTLESIKANTSDFEVVVVDDGSTDNSCDRIVEDGLCTKLITHKKRIGIAPSRNDGVDNAKGDCFAFFDAHQKVTEGCINRCAELALERGCIVWPCVTGSEQSNWLGHGALMRQKDGRKAGLFHGRWRRHKQLDTVSRCSTMIVPGYVIPQSVWPKVRLIDGLRNHGASEPALTVKAFFAEVDILHLCGPIAYHRFNSKVPFPCTGKEQIRNHGLVARVCFDNDTWENYWSKTAVRKVSMEEFNTEIVLEQHRAFQEIKKRPDEEFWRGLILQPKLYR